MGFPQSSAGPFAPQSANWQPQTNYTLIGQLVVNAGLLYEVSTAHKSTNVFDASKFTALGGAASNINPTIIVAAGTTRTLAAPTNAPNFAIVQMTLDQASCALTHTGFVNNDGIERTLEVHVIGSAGKTITFTDTFNSMSAGVVPLAVTNGITVYTVWTDGDTKMNISHGQRIRPIFWHPQRGNISALTTDGSWKLNYDARVVGGEVLLGTAGTVQSTIVDFFRNAVSLWTGVPGNRPTVAIGSTDSGAITLPASPIIAPTDLLQWQLAQVGTNAAELYARLDLLVAV